jgi:hypothetical protein
MSVFTLLRGCCGASVWFVLTGYAAGQTQPGALPRFEDYPVKEASIGVIALPKLVTPMERNYSQQITDGVQNGYGVVREGKEQKGANFAGSLIVIELGCGSPCKRMFIVNAATGDIYYPPISFSGVGTKSFDLPLLMIGNSYPENPEVQFRLDSNLMIIKATPSEAGRHPSYTYYFLWNQSRWTLLRRLPLR